MIRKKLAFVNQKSEYKKNPTRDYDHKTEGEKVGKRRKIVDSHGHGSPKRSEYFTAR